MPGRRTPEREVNSIGKKSEGKTPMSPKAAARIQSTQERGGKDTGKGSFPARAQRAAAKRD